MRPAKPANAFLAFVLTGGIAALVNVLTRYALSFAMAYEAAVALAYLAGMTTAFVLARRYVFAGSGRSWLAEYGRFATVNIAAFIQVWGLSMLLARALFPALGLEWHAEDLAHLIGVVSPVVTSFYLHKHFSFGQRRQGQDGAAVVELRGIEPLTSSLRTRRSPN